MCVCVDSLTKLLRSTYIEILTISRTMTYDIQRNEFVESHLGSIQIKCRMLAITQFRIFCIPVRYPKIWKLKYIKLQFCLLLYVGVKTGISS
jgi:hypothetical protein